MINGGGERNPLIEVTKSGSEYFNFNMFKIDPSNFLCASFWDLTSLPQKKLFAQLIILTLSKTCCSEIEVLVETHSFTQVYKM